MHTPDTPHTRHRERLVTVKVTQREHSLLLEALRIAQSELLKTAETLYETWPGARMVDTLREWASEVSALRERLEDK